MRFERLYALWENARTSLWYLPTIFSICAALLAITLTEVDRRYELELNEYRTWIFAGSPSAARTLLSAIGGSLITVISLLFSITIVALQQASTQFTPRVFRNFTSDRGSQIVLGSYLATFLYALLVLRQVRGEDAAGGTFVPIISVSVAVLLAIVCLGLLIYFIHHAATLLKASTVIERVHRELLGRIDKLYPAGIGEPIEADGIDPPLGSGIPESRGDLVAAVDMAGFLQSIDEETIASALPGGSWATVYPLVGDYITRDTLLIEVSAIHRRLDDEQREQLRSAFLLGEERTLHQDAMFAVRQLADIALKALSPSINDPTTAEHAISCLGDALTKLVQRSLPERHRLVHEPVEEDGSGPVVLELHRPTFADFVAEAFDQVRLAARGDAHVMMHLLDALASIAHQADAGRKEILRQQVTEILWYMEQADLSPGDLQRFRTGASEAVAAVNA